jgi:lipopolysaccharide biosynthesis glycosyltransferase
MKNLIYQTFINSDNYIPKFARISTIAFTEYAEKHGAEYQFNNISKLNPKSSIPEWYERYILIYDESFDEYDNILYVDSDIFPINMDENIFDIDYGGIAAYPLQDEEVHGKKEKNNFCQYYECAFEGWYNTGTLLMNREMRQRMREEFFPIDDIPEKEHSMRLLNYDEAWFTINMKLNGFPITHLHRKWNSIHNINENDFPPDTNFAHYNGVRCKKLMCFDHGHLI